ncbi:MAG: CCA tRNA nucleotidyltransferase, partial [Patescibacteria group bacterium]
MNKILDKLPTTLIKANLSLKKALPEAEIYLVGGAVRDLLLNRMTKDYDLVVKNVPVEILENKLKQLGDTNLVGKNFGVFKWLPLGWLDEAIDIALPRTEHSLNLSGRYRDFKIQSDHNLSIEQDLARRDFTINALALNLSDGKIIDPHNGQTDLNNKIIKAIGQPTDRLQEDLSRALRALRFACQLNFNIEQKTLSAIKQAANQVVNGQSDNLYLVPRETIAKEFLKSLIADPIKIIKLYQDNDYLKLLLPEVWSLSSCPQPPQFHSEGDVLTHTQLALESLNSLDWQKYFPDQEANLTLLLAILLHDIGKPLTLQTPDQHGVDRIRTHNHDTIGAQIALQIINRLKLTSYVDKEFGNIDSQLTSWLIANHMLLAHSQPQDLKPTTIYKYFLKETNKGQLLLQLLFADIWATRPQNNLRLLDGFDILLTKINEVKSALPQDGLKLLLNGEAIMTNFNMEPGPKIGQLLKILEEAQVNGLVKTEAEAIEYLKN